MSLHHWHADTEQAPLDDDLDLLLDERTGVKLLGLDAVVEDPATDPAFDTYKVRRERGGRVFVSSICFFFFFVLCRRGWLNNTTRIPSMHVRNTQASIRRLLSLSTKLETLYLLLVPGGDPLQHRAAIRAISNAVLNCTRMVRGFLPPHTSTHISNHQHLYTTHNTHTGGGCPRRLRGGPWRASPPPARRRGRHPRAAGGA